MEKGQVTERGATMWNWIKELFGAAIKALYTVAMPLVKEEVVALLNDAEAQDAAKRAIYSASEQGLKNNEALDAAVEILKGKGLASGERAATTILKTLVQNAYCAMKCAEG